MAFGSELCGSYLNSRLIRSHDTLNPKCQAKTAHKWTKTQKTAPATIILLLLLP